MMHTSTRTLLRRSAPGLLMTLAVALFLAGCEQPTNGIFASIQAEEKIENLGLPDDVAVGGVAILDGSYYAGVKSLFTRPVVPTEGSTADWSQVENTPGEGWTVISLAADGSNLYVSFSDDAGTFQGVYSYDGEDWSTEPVDQLAEGSTAIRLLGLDGNGDYLDEEIVLLEEEPQSEGQPRYRLVFDPFGSPAESGYVSRIIDGVKLSGGEYWFISKDYFYRGTGAASVATTREDPADVSGDISGAGELAGITRDGSDNIYLSAVAGRVYRRLSGQWDSGSVTDAAPLRNLTFIPAPGSREAEIYVGVGRTDDAGGGYFSSPATADALDFGRPADDPSYVSGEISAADVSGFAVFAESSLVSEADSAYGIFALTADYGLWRRALAESGGTASLESWAWQ